MVLLLQLKEKSPDMEGSCQCVEWAATVIIEVAGGEGKEENAGD